MTVPSVRLELDADPYIQSIARLANQLRAGKVATTGTITLDVSPATTTVLNNAFLSPLSTVLFDPMTETAAGLDGAGLFVLEANRGTGTWTITHEAGTAADRKFKYVVLG